MKLRKYICELAPKQKYMYFNLKYTFERVPKKIINKENGPRLKYILKSTKFPVKL